MNALIPRDHDELGRGLLHAIASELLELGERTAVAAGEQAAMQSADCDVLGDRTWR